jgi:hypothetical protein
MALAIQARALWELGYPPERIIQDSGDIPPERIIMSPMLSVRLRSLLEVVRADFKATEA